MLSLNQKKVPRQGTEKLYAARVVFPTIPKSFVMFYFTMLGSYIDLHFWNRLLDDFASAREAYKSIAFRNYVVIVVAGYWNRKPDSGQHSSSTKILISPWK